MSEAMTRREFVHAAAVLGAGVAIATLPGCGGAPGTNRAKVATPSSSFGGGSEMGGRVLVGYATRTGATTGVAEAIGETLAARGFAVDVKPLRERPVLEGYDAVVLGSAVNGGNWLPEALAYVESHRDALKKVPVAAFCVHIMNMGDDDKSRTRRVAYLDQLRTMVEPVDEGFFAGVGPTAKDTSLIARWAFRAFGGGGEGDCRDWDKIRAWARDSQIGNKARS